MFEQLIGNNEVKQLLRSMVASERLPGAMLFTGTERVGKKLFALDLAKALNCRVKPRKGCGQCSSCTRISKFNFPQSADPDDWKSIIWTDHPDVGMVVAPKRLLLVEQMRAIEHEANYRPFEGTARFFLIDDAEKLNDASANALLKVLEEPPHTSYLILLTSRPAMLLPTIRSRCQMIRFAPIAPEEIEKHLVANKLANAADARIRARVARGSLGRAITQDLDEFMNQRKAMLKILESLTISEDRAQLLRSSEELNDARYKDEFEPRLDVLEALIRDAWMLSLGTRSEEVVNIDLLPQLEKISKRLQPGRAGRWILEIEEMREQLVVNINRKASTDALFLTMAAASAPLTKRRFLIK